MILASLADLGVFSAFAGVVAFVLGLATWLRDRR